MTRLARQSVILALIGLGALLALAFSSLAQQVRQESPVFSLGSLPYVLFGLIAVLSVRIHQLRIAQLALVFALAYAGLTEPELRAKLASPQVYRLSLALALPLSAVIVALFREATLVSARGLLSTAASLLPSLLVLRLASRTHLLEPVFAWRALPEILRTPIPDASYVLVAVFVVVAYRLRDPITTSLDIGIVAGFAPILYVLGLGSKATPVMSAIAFSAAGAALLYSVFTVYWQRVYTDELTGVPNRRALGEYLKTLGGRYVIAMVDVDHFKKFNDRYGHDEGDNVLRLVAKHFARESRGRTFRYGGEEFAVVYRRASAERAYDHLDRARSRLAKRAFWLRAPKSVRAKSSKKDRGTTIPDKKKVVITASIGLAERADRKSGSQDVLKKADKALYQAKKKGRNRVVIA